MLKKNDSVRYLVSSSTAFHPLPVIWVVRLSAFHYRTKSFMLAQNRQSTNQQNQNSTLLLLEILFTLFTLHFVTETTSHIVGTRHKHRMWLVDFPPRCSVPQCFWPGRNRACQGNTGHEKECKIFDRLLKKERFSRARSLPSLNQLLIKNTTCMTSAQVIGPINYPDPVICLLMINISLTLTLWQVKT